ncbi:unnamed protein product [Arctogadus glacialis]
MSVEKSENKFILPVGRRVRDATAVSVVVVRAAPDRRHGARDSVSTPALYRRSPCSSVNPLFIAGLSPLNLAVSGGR